MSLPRADGPLGAAPRAPAADPADDGITTVTVTLREDSRGGATHALSRKREDARLGDDDDASRGDPPRASRVSTGACFADSFPEWTERSDDGALSLSRGSDLLPNDDAWNAVLTAFEAHCLRGEDGADRGDEAPRQNAARFESEETPSSLGVFAFADSPARVGASRSCVDGLPLLPSPFLCVDHTLIDAPISTRDPHKSNGSNADRMDKQSRVRANASAAETKLPSDEVFDNLASDLPSSPNPVTAAERVRAHAARALRSLIFGRDDGRGRRRSALEGPRVSRRGAKPKSVRSRSRAPTRAGASPRNVNEDVSGTPDERFDEKLGLDFDFDDVLDPDVDPEDTSLGAHYALRDPARWRAAATTASSVAAVEAAAALAAAAGSRSRSRSGCDTDANDASVSKLAALRKDFVVELERLAVVERALVAGERGALARWPSPDWKSEPVGSEALPLGSPPAEEGDVSGGDCLGDRLEETVVVSATSGAARAMRRSAAARFRECRFRVLETFERDAAKVARFLEKNSLSTHENEKYTETAETRARRDDAAAAGRKEGRKRKRTNDAYGTGRDGATSSHETLSEPATLSQPARLSQPATFKGGGKSRHSARARGVLEAWLAEHFYPTPFRSKPVPTREEKKRLALETGLTERQVGDWFVNARARVWKPEMKALLGEIHTER